MTAGDWWRLTARRIPCWAPIGLDGSQQLVDVRLRAHGREFDVNDENVVASLVPLTIAVGVPALRGGELLFMDRRGGRELARLQLRAAPDAALPGATLLRVTSGEHSCLPRGLRAWHRLRQAKWRHEGGFRMANAAVQHLALMYLCPRPVVLVSVDDGTHDNLFPMDLVGPLSGGFMLSLRNSSPSVGTIRASRRVALADAALDRLKTVYALGKHHHLARIDWNGLPFESARSSEYGLRVPADAMRVRECDIERWREIGSHTLFTCRVVSERTSRDAPRLHHTCGLHRVWRERTGEGLPWHEAGR